MVLLVGEWCRVVGRVTGMKVSRVTGAEVGENAAFWVDEAFAELDVSYYYIISLK